MPHVSPNKTEIVSVDGSRTYYEVYGSGPSLFLLHGYGLSSKSWAPYVADFAHHYTVYLVDLPGHGRSEPFKRRFSIVSAANNFNVLIDYLGLDSIRAIGFSYGGDVLFQLAAINTPLLHSMIAIGAIGRWDVSEHPNLQKIYTAKNVDITDYHADEDQISSIFEQFRNYAVNVTDAQLSATTAEVLLVLGDNDPNLPLQKVNHVREKLSKSNLWILPNVSHSAHEGPNRREFTRIAIEFLSKSGRWKP